MKFHNVTDQIDAENADLRGSVFVDANLAGTRFEDVNMTGGEFSNVNLTDVNISNANLAGMTIDGVRVPDLFAAYKTLHEKPANV